MIRLIVFDIHARDWTILREFNTEEEAQSFVDKYPRFGAEHSRTMRQGDWQILQSKSGLAG